MIRAATPTAPKRGVCVWVGWYCRGRKWGQTLVVARCTLFYFITYLLHRAFILIGCLIRQFGWASRFGHQYAAWSSKLYLDFSRVWWWWWWWTLLACFVWSFAGLACFQDHPHLTQLPEHVLTSAFPLLIKTPPPSAQLSTLQFTDCSKILPRSYLLWSRPSSVESWDVLEDLDSRGESERKVPMCRFEVRGEGVLAGKRQTWSGLWMRLIAMESAKWDGGDEGGGKLKTPRSRIENREGSGCSCSLRKLEVQCRKLEDASRKFRLLPPIICKFQIHYLFCSGQRRRPACFAVLIVVRGIARLLKSHCWSLEVIVPEIGNLLCCF